EIQPVAHGMIGLSAMQVRFWGTRGSIAAPGPSTARFGGNTSCVEVRASDGTVIILDCGTGRRQLGLHLAQTTPQPIRLHPFLGHTPPTIAYSMTSDGATMSYATDHEPFWNASGRVSQHPGDERHIAFLKGANLVIHDAQYTDAEYRDKVGWGHSSIEYAVDVALAAGVERLVLFHHDPAHNDSMMEQMETMAQAHVGRRGQALEVLAAREGLELQVRGSSAVPDMAEASALQHRRIIGGRVLLVSANDPEAAELAVVLGDDALVFLG